MSVIDKSLYEKISLFIMRNLKKCLFFLGGITLSILILSSLMINTKNYCKIYTTQVVLAQELCEKHKYNEAIEELNKINIKSKKANEFQEHYLLAMKYKIANLMKDKNLLQQYEQEIKNIKYTSQSNVYEKFSITGELLLNTKMQIHYENKEYEQCDKMLLKHQMQKLPHYYAYILRAKSFQDNNCSLDARYALLQNYMYGYDPSSLQVFSSLCYQALISVK
jgi:hypothetical protein